MKIKAIIMQINNAHYTQVWIFDKSRVNCVLKRKDMKNCGLQEAV